MGDEQKVGYEELLAQSKAAFEEVPDFTVAVEEEFALLDPATLELTNRFEDVLAATAGTDLEPHLAGELIASEAEVRTGRCDTFADCIERMGERRAQLRAVTESLGINLSSAGTHPWSSWKEQRIIDTPHYRRNDEYLRYVVWRNNTFGLHVHVGINGPDRAIKVMSGLRNFMPELLAVSASSPFVEGLYTYLHSARTQIFTRMFPRCGIPDAFEDWADWERYVRFLYETGSITEHTQIWWSVRPHLAFPTVEMRICDAQPDLAEARSLTALIYSLTARIARAVDDGEPLPVWPHRLLEENLWRAIRYGLSGELIDFERGESIPARARLEQMLEWVQPVADELGASSWLQIPDRNSAERQIARHEEGATMEEIFAEQVAAGDRVSG
ncbi:MAG: glutamate---cysteine ligase / carboxylate-amine ligase [Gaiellaceae bacterium]|nr:glutamate---cysteine ligase / carboxylate-amine ligase [Gaiellaceae bacterium]